MDRGLPGFGDGSIFASLFDAYPDALLLTDAGGRIVLANPAATVLLGYPAGELAGLTVEALVPDAVRARHAAYRDAYARAPRVRPMGTQRALAARRRDGSEVMVEIALSPLQDRGLPYVVAAIRGIGDYPRVKQALRQARYSEHLAQFGRLAVDSRDLQHLLGQAPRVAADALQVELAMVYLLDADRQALRVAGGVGLTADQGLGARVPNRPDTLAGFVVAEGRPVVVDGPDGGPVVLSAGHREAGLVHALAVPLSDRGRPIGVLAVHTRDAGRFGADEVRLLESLSNLLGTTWQRAQSDEALNHAQRLESIGQLTGGIAHDFNNLLTVILGNLQVLDDTPTLADDAAGRPMVEAAARAARRGAELTAKLLAFSRRQRLQAVPVDVDLLLQSLAGMLRRTLDRRIRIEVGATPRGLRCLADPGQLEAALLNVALNARDAMPDGGRLAFDARAVAGPPGPAPQHPPDGAAADGVAISVADTGTGMPEAVRRRAFEPFFTTKEPGRGTGLGLSTVYGFVHQSHGAATIDSAPGAGTTVTLLLPRCDDAGAPESRGAAASVPPGLRVLVVEDDDEVRALVQGFLAALGCRPTPCAGAAEALALLGSAGAAPFDLLLTDIALGAGLPGTELARQARQRWPALPVLLMSGFSKELPDAALPWPLLRKPFDRDQLARALAQAAAPA